MFLPNRRKINILKISLGNFTQKHFNLWAISYNSSKVWATHMCLEYDAITLIVAPCQCSEIFWTNNCTKTVALRQLDLAK